jgi:hypothetical protein
MSTKEKTNQTHSYHRAKGLGYIGFGVILLMGLLNVIFFGFSNVKTSAIDINGKYFVRMGINDDELINHVTLGSGSTSHNYYIFNSAVDFSTATPGSLSANFIAHINGSGEINALNPNGRLNTTSGVTLYFAEYDPNDPQYYVGGTIGGDKNWSAFSLGRNLVEYDATHPGGTPKSSSSAVSWRYPALKANIDSEITQISISCYNNQPTLNYRYTDPDYMEYRPYYDQTWWNTRVNLDIYSVSNTSEINDNNRLIRLHHTPGSSLQRYTIPMSDSRVAVGKKFYLYGLDYIPYQQVADIWTSDYIVFENNPCESYSLNSDKASAQINNDITFTAKLPDNSTFNGSQVEFDYKDGTKDLVNVSFNAAGYYEAVQAHGFITAGTYAVQARVKKNGSYVATDLDSKTITVSIFGSNNRAPEYTFDFNYDKCWVEVDYNRDLDWSRTLHTASTELFRLDIGDRLFQNVEIFYKHFDPEQVWNGTAVSKTNIEFPAWFKNMTSTDANWNVSYRVNIFAADYQPSLNRIDEAAQTRWIKRSQFAANCDGTGGTPELPQIQGVSCSNEKTGMKVSWTIINDPVINPLVTGYKVKYQKSGVFVPSIKDVLGRTTTYTILLHPGEIAANVPYAISVAGFGGPNQNDIGQYSNPITCTYTVVPNDAPTCTLGITPGEGAPGTNFAFKSWVNDPDGDVPVTRTRLLISYGDGSSEIITNPVFAGAPPTLNKVVSKQGNHVATLEVKDSRNAVGTCSANFKVTTTTTNHNPTCTISVNPVSGPTGTSFRFSATKADQDTGDTTTYKTLTFSNSLGTVNNPTFPYDKTVGTAGTYTATLQVEDGHGGTGTCTTNFTVSTTTTNHAPTCTLTASPVSGTKPLRVTFTSTTNDLDTGDTVTRQTLAYGDGQSKSNPGASEIYTYNNAGTFTARLTVKDSRNATGTCTASVQVNNISVTSPTVDIRASQNTVTAFNQASNSLTNVPRNSNFYLHWNIAQGSGSITNVSVTPIIAGGGTINAALTKLNYGPGTATNNIQYSITVTDSNGKTATDTVSISVAAVPLTASLSANPMQTAPGGGSVTLSWTTQNATSATIVGKSVPGGAVLYTYTIPAGSVTSGNTTTNVTQTTAFTLTASNAAGTATDSKTVQVPTVTCVNDAKEPNNTAATAATLNSATTQLKLCPQDIDWFVAYAEAGDDIFFRGEFSNTQGEDIDMYLYNSATPGVVAVASSNSQTNAFEEITYTAPTAGYYYLKVMPYASGTMPVSGIPYTLKTEVGCLSDVSAANSRVLVAETATSTPVSSLTIPADNTTTAQIRVILKDSEGNLLANEPVLVEGDSSACTGTCTTSTFTIDPTTGISNANGRFFSTIKSGTNEVVTIKAHSSCVEITETAEVIFEAESYSCAFTATPTSITNDGATSNIQVTVTNTNNPGTPLVGANVAFAVSGINSANATFTPATAVTDANSRATTQFSATQTGTATVSATVNGKTCTGNVAITVTEQPANTGKLELTVPLQGRDLLTATDAAHHAYPITLELYKRNGTAHESVFTTNSVTAMTDENGLFPATNDPNATAINNVLYNLDTTAASNPYLIKVYSNAHLVDSAYIYIDAPLNVFTLADPGLLAGNVSQSTIVTELEEINTADVIWFYTQWMKHVTTQDATDPAFIADLNGNGKVGAEDFSILVSNLNASEPATPPVVTSTTSPVTPPGTIAAESMKIATPTDYPWKGFAVSDDATCEGGMLNLRDDNGTISGFITTSLSQSQLAVTGKLNTSGNAEGSWGTGTKSESAFDGSWLGENGMGTWSSPATGCEGTYTITRATSGFTR